MSNASLVPMLKEAELIGAVAIFRQKVRTWSAQVAAAADRHRRRLKMISRSTFDLQTALDTLISRQRFVPSGFCSYSTSADTALQHSASYGMSPEMSEYMQSHPLWRHSGLESRLPRHLGAARG